MTLQKKNGVVAYDHPTHSTHIKDTENCSEGSADFKSGDLITLISSKAPATLCKSYRMVDGVMQKTPIANMTKGVANTVRVDTAQAFADLLRGVTESSNQVIVPGVFHNAEVGQPFHILTAEKLAEQMGVTEAPVGVQMVKGHLAAARLKAGIDHSSWVLFDADSPEGMPSEWAAMTIGERLQAFEGILPNISTCERIELRASSARVDDGTGAGKATHAWIRFTHPEKLDLLYAHVRTAMVLSGLSFVFKKHSRTNPDEMIGLEPRTLFDLAVWHAGRLAFCAKPVVDIPNYSVADADVRIVNEGAGAYNNEWITMPSHATIRELRDISGTDLLIKQFGNKITMEQIGVLTLETEIEVRGEVKPFGEWVSELAIGDKLRCETPFRESQSEAAFIRMPTSGKPFLFDSGTGITYRLAKETPKASVRTPEGVVRAIGHLCSTLGMTERELAKAIDIDYGVIDSICAATVFNQSNSKFVVLKASGEYLQFVPPALQGAVEDIYGRVANTGALSDLLFNHAHDTGMFSNLSEAKATTAISNFVKANNGLIFSALQKHISIHRQFNVLEMGVDMFAESSSISLFDGCATMTLPHIPFPAGAINPAIIADYKEHFPQIDSFLDLLVASRFAAARKKAFLWIKAESDWGKGVLTNALGNLGLRVSITADEVEMAFGGKPVGKTMPDFKRAWVLEFNEFKSVKSELKMLEQSIQFAPKGLPTVTVPLYLKLFTSAEWVPSLASEESGVEDQFANRFSLIEPVGTIDSRPLFRASRGSYVITLTNYIADYLNKRVAEYRAMGASRAADRGDEVVVAYHAKFGIGNRFQCLSEKLNPMADNFLDWVLDTYDTASTTSATKSRGLTISEREVFANSHVREEDGTPILYVSSPIKLLEVWMNDVYTKAERGKLLWKTSEFKKRLPEVTKVRFGKFSKDVMCVGRVVAKHGLIYCEDTGA